MGDADVRSKLKYTVLNIDLSTSLRDCTAVSATLSDDDG